MNQNTILIMIVVGLAVVVFLVILYCFQQRQRRADRRLGNSCSLILIPFLTPKVYQPELMGKLNSFSLIKHNYMMSQVPI